MNLIDTIRLDQIATHLRQAFNDFSALPPEIKANPDVQKAKSLTTHAYAAILAVTTQPTPPRSITTKTTTIES